MHGSGDGGTRRRVPATNARSAASTADASNSAGVPEEGRFRPSGSSNVLGEVPGRFGRMSAMQGPGMGQLMGHMPQQPIVWQPWGYHTYAGPWHQDHVVNSSSIPPWTPQYVLSDIQEVHDYGRGPIAPSRPPLPAQLLWGQAEAGQTGQQANRQVLTFIVQNIPARCTPHRLLQLFQPARDGIDFLYLPFRYRQKRSSRYAFVNFRSTNEAARFRDRWEGVALAPHDRPLVFGPAKTQGLAANMYLHAAGRERERSIEPVVFYNGEEVSFEWAWACLVRTLSEADWELVVQEANKTSAGEAGASQGGCGSRVVFSL
ncbi:unnamed protein product [Symbiodinium sp. CCMP2456]|nr:unnamed protein product [Symbiodinium sp. CCMP2456]